VLERAYRADLLKLRKLLLDAADLAIVEEKTHDPGNYAALGVDEPSTPEARGTLLEIGAGKQTRRLIVGRNSGMKTGFVRVPAQTGTVLATPQLNLEAQPAAWLDRQLFDLPPERIKTLARLPARPATKTPQAEPEPDPSFAAFAFDDLRSAPPGAPLPPQLTIETRDGMLVELAGLRDGSRSYITVNARGLEGAEPKVHREASELAARTAGRQFELPAYRYELLFPSARAPAGKTSPPRAKPSAARPAASDRG
jgi:hypothetical protein